MCSYHALLYIVVRIKMVFPCYNSLHKSQFCQGYHKTYDTQVLNRKVKINNIINNTYMLHKNIFNDLHKVFFLQTLALHVQIISALAYSFMLLPFSRKFEFKKPCY